MSKEKKYTMEEFLGAVKVITIFTKKRCEAELERRRAEAELHPVAKVVGVGAHTPKEMDWGVLWQAKGYLGGSREHLLRDNDCRVVMFTTRKKCREWINESHGYIKTRKDLRAYPFGWRLPKPVKLKITYES